MNYDIEREWFERRVAQEADLVIGDLTLKNVPHPSGENHMTIETELPAVKVKPLSDYRIPGQCNCGDCLHIRQEKDALTLKDESIERFSPEFQARFKKMEEWAASLGDDPGDGGADEIIALRTRCAELVKALEDVLPMAEDKWANPDQIEEILGARVALASYRKRSEADGE